jgi:hypothetical protein
MMVNEGNYPKSPWKGVFEVKVHVGNNFALILAGG